MVATKMYRKIQQLRQSGKSISEIARRLSLDRKTAAKYYHMDTEAFRTYHQNTVVREKSPELHHTEILSVYRENGWKRLNMAAVYDYLVECYGEIKYTERTLRNYIAYLEKTGELTISDSVRMTTKVPQLPFGKQLQMDFGQYRCPSGLVLYIFACVLSASRYKYMVFQDHPFVTMDVVLHLLSCFQHLGGLVEEVVIDQDALLVVSENSGDIIFTRTFASFIEEMGLSMYVCRKADPQSKGKIEQSIKYVKQNFLSIRSFDSVEEANAALQQWLGRRANGVISRATKRIPAELLLCEQEQLQPLRNSIFYKDDVSLREERQVNEHSYVSVGGSLYSVPAKYRNRVVEIYQTPSRVFLFDAHSGEELAEHAVATIPGSTVSQRSHFRSTEQSAEQLRSEIRYLVDLPEWIEFEQRNAKRFPRYVRDQAIDAKKYFSGEVDRDVLLRALDFCREYETYSYANLNDTYRAFLVEQTGDDPLDEPAGLMVEIPHVGVSTRSLEHYQNVIGRMSEEAAG